MLQSQLWSAGVISSVPAIVDIVVAALQFVLDVFDAVSVAHAGAAVSAIAATARDDGPIDYSIRVGLQVCLTLIALLAMVA